MNHVQETPPFQNTFKTRPVKKLDILMNDDGTVLQFLGRDSVSEER